MLSHIQCFPFQFSTFSLNLIFRVKRQLLTPCKKGRHSKNSNFQTPFGIFEFVRLTFGLCIAIQRFILQVVPSVDFCFVYLTTLRHVEQVFERSKDHGLSINVPKFTFHRTEVKSLGHKHFRRTHNTSQRTKSVKF